MFVYCFCLYYESVFLNNALGLDILIFVLEASPVTIDGCPAKHIFPNPARIYNPNFWSLGEGQFWITMGENPSYLVLLFVDTPIRTYVYMVHVDSVIIPDDDFGLLNRLRRMILEYFLSLP